MCDVTLTQRKCIHPMVAYEFVFSHFGHSRVCVCCVASSSGQIRTPPYTTALASKSHSAKNPKIVRHLEKIYSRASIVYRPHAIQ